MENAHNKDSLIIDKCGCFRNCFNHVPDDILLSILSRLTLKEAARTSVLARRWRYMWAYCISDLNFDASATIEYLDKNRDQSINDERLKYVSWVTAVVKSHRSTTIERLRVRFFLDNSFARDIDAWLQYALPKGVKRLELDFSTSSGGCHSDCYPFPNTCDPVEGLQLFPTGFKGFIPLVTLCLKSVDVSGEVLEFFISNCPFLEQLSVGNSDSLIDLKIKSSASLKHLEIRGCWHMKSLEIHAPNLASFSYLGPKVAMAIENIPQLVNLFFGLIYPHILADMLIPFYGYFTHLERLTLHVSIIGFGLELIGFPCFPRLRKLVFNTQAEDDESLLSINSLIDAAPHLDEFKLELLWMESLIEKRPIIQAEGRPHHCLKVVEIVGFVGGTIDIEFAIYLSRIATSLEKMIIDPRSIYAKGDCDLTDDNKKVTARKRAKELKAALSPQTKLVIR